MPMYKIVVDSCNMPNVNFSEEFYREANNFQEAIIGIDNIKSVIEVGKSYKEHTSKPMFGVMGLRLD